MCGNNTGDVVILHVAGSLKDTYSVLARASSTTVPAIKSANEAPERSKLQALRCALVTRSASAHHANARPSWLAAACLHRLFADPAFMRLDREGLVCSASSDFLRPNREGLVSSASSGFLRPSRNPFIDGLLSSRQSHRLRTRRCAIYASQNMR